MTVCVTTVIGIQAGVMHGTTSVPAQNAIMVRLIAGDSATCGEPNLLTVVFDDAARSDYRATVSWGDGSSTTYAAIASGYTAMHRYPRAGVYQASVVAFDGQGNISATVTTTLRLELSAELQAGTDGTVRVGRPLDLRVRLASCSAGEEKGSLLKGGFPARVVVDRLRLERSDVQVAAALSAATPILMRRVASGEFTSALPAKSLAGPGAYRVLLMVVPTGQRLETTFVLLP